MTLLELRFRIDSQPAPGRYGHNEGQLNFTPSTLTNDLFDQREWRILAGDFTHRYSSKSTGLKEFHSSNWCFYKDRGNKRSEMDCGGAKYLIYIFLKAT
ncbi:hypothetical protein NPIL_437271 [Nephila pilipes]|uniref:Uncharacterized protein n=1 Tax=Nephila pilipes TaxID=299642 RepID=A0A8X6Q5I1_NEPPI|nr:hypothetical protein NPIL_437271 [Nephila pilipes]